LLEGLKPTVKVVAPQGWQPAIEFDGETGEATTPGMTGKPDFAQYLKEAGYDPATVEVVGNVRTSRWQRYDGEWLTAYRFQFTTKTGAITDLPLLWKTAKQGVKKPKPVESDKVLVVALSDFQIGKVDERGGTQELIARIFETYDLLEKKIRSGKYSQILVVDVGDIVEGFANAADMNQAVTNDLSLMQQVDTGISLVWDFIKRSAKYAPVRYVTVASNHCQFRLNKQRVGRVGVDDWGVMIAQQIHRLAKETELPVTVHIPQPNDESLALDVFGDSFHILGIVHGHQVNRPEGFPDWWRKQAFGKQPIHSANICLSGHFHHLRVQELGDNGNNGSRYWIQAPTMDAGSGWYRLNSGEDSKPGIACFELQKNVPFTGTVWKI
jgi:hypothetical protein